MKKEVRYIFPSFAMISDDLIGLADKAKNPKIKRVELIFETKNHLILSDESIVDKNVYSVSFTNREAVKIWETRCKEHKKKLKNKMKEEALLKKEVLEKFYKTFFSDFRLMSNCYEMLEKRGLNFAHFASFAKQNSSTVGCNPESLFREFLQYSKGNSYSLEKFEKEFDHKKTFGRW